MAGFVLRSRPNVDHRCFTATDAPSELVAGDGLQAVSAPEVGLCEAIDFRHVLGGDLAHHDPQLQDLVARQLVDHARALATGAHETGPSEVAEVVGGIGDALSELGRHFLDRSFPLRQQIDDFRPPPAGYRLAH